MGFVNSVNSVGEGDAPVRLRARTLSGSPCPESHRRCVLACAGIAPPSLAHPRPRCWGWQDGSGVAHCFTFGGSELY